MNYLYSLYSKSSYLQNLDFFEMIAAILATLADKPSYTISNTNIYISFALQLSNHLSSFLPYICNLVLVGMSAYCLSS